MLPLTNITYRWFEYPKWGLHSGFGSDGEMGLIVQGFFHLLHIFDYFSNSSTPNSWRKNIKYAEKKIGKNEEILEQLDSNSFSENHKSDFKYYPTFH